MQYLTSKQKAFVVRKFKVQIQPKLNFVDYTLSKPTVNIRWQCKFLRSFDFSKNFPLYCFDMFASFPIFDRSI